MTSPSEPEPKRRRKVVDLREYSERKRIEREEKKRAAAERERLGWPEEPGW
jgi:hypothetical protein